MLVIVRCYSLFTGLLHGCLGRRSLLLLVFVFGLGSLPNATNAGSASPSNEVKGRQWFLRHNSLCQLTREYMNEVPYPSLSVCLSLFLSFPPPCFSHHHSPYPLSPLPLSSTPSLPFPSIGIDQPTPTLLNPFFLLLTSEAAVKRLLSTPDPSPGSPSKETLTL